MNFSFFELYPPQSYALLDPLGTVQVRAGQRLHALHVPRGKPHLPDLPVSKPPAPHPTDHVMQTRKLQVEKKAHRRKHILLESETPWICPLGQTQWGIPPCTSILGMGISIGALLPRTLSLSYQGHIVLFTSPSHSVIHILALPCMTVHTCTLSPCPSLSSQGPVLHCTA